LGNGYLDSSEGLHPFVEVDDSVSPDINKIEKIFDDCKTGDRLGGEFAQAHDKFIELIKGHSSCIISIKLEK
jgi:hypothetical protein